MTSERVHTLLNVGDRLVLWAICMSLIGLFIWHDQEAEQNSPTLIAPVCVTVTAKTLPPRDQP